MLLASVVRETGCGASRGCYVASMSRSRGRAVASCRYAIIGATVEAIAFMNIRGEKNKHYGYTYAGTICHNARGAPNARQRHIEQVVKQIQRRHNTLFVRQRVMIVDRRVVATAPRAASTANNVASYAQVANSAVTAGKNTLSL